MVLKHALTAVLTAMTLLSGQALADDPPIVSAFRVPGEQGAPAGRIPEQSEVDSCQRRVDWLYGRDAEQWWPTQTIDSTISPRRLRRGRRLLISTLEEITSVLAQQVERDQRAGVPTVVDHLQAIRGFEAFFPGGFGPFYSIEGGFFQSMEDHHRYYDVGQPHAPPIFSRNPERARSQREDRMDPSMWQEAESYEEEPGRRESYVIGRDLFLQSTLASENIRGLRIETGRDDEGNDETGDETDPERGPNTFELAERNLRRAIQTVVQRKFSDWGEFECVGDWAFRMPHRGMTGAERVTLETDSSENGAMLFQCTRQRRDGRPNIHFVYERVRSRHWVVELDEDGAPTARPQRLGSVLKAVFQYPEIDIPGSAMGGLRVQLESNIGIATRPGLLRSAEALPVTAYAHLRERPLMYAHFPIAATSADELRWRLIRRLFTVCQAFPTLEDLRSRQ